MLEEIKNIGIPCYNPLTLNLYETTLNCSKSKKDGIIREREIRKEIYNRYTKEISTKSIAKHKELLTYIDFTCNNNSKGILTLTNKTIYKNIFNNILNDNLDNDIDTIKKEIRDSLRILTELNNRIKKDTYTKEDILLIKNKYSNLYNNRSNYYNVFTYLNIEIKYLKELYNYLDTFNIDITDLISYYEEGLSEERFGLYLVYNYLKEVDNCLLVGDYINTQKYLFYVSAFFDKINKSNKSIYINNKYITYEMLKDKYNYILNNNNLKELILDRELFINKDININNEVINNLLTMHRYYIEEQFVKKGRQPDKKSLNDNLNIDNISKEELQQIRKYLSERYYLYLKTKPVAQIQCIHNFSNYIAFLYENGIIIADRLNNINRLSECNKDAVYLFNVLNFDEKIKLDKGVLIGNTKRILHKEGWEDKVSRLVSYPTPEQTKILTKEFMYKHK